MAVININVKPLPTVNDTEKAVIFYVAAFDNIRLV